MNKNKICLIVPLNRTPEGVTRFPGKTNNLQKNKVGQARTRSLKEIHMRTTYIENEDRVRNVRESKQTTKKIILISSSSKPRRG